MLADNMTRIIEILNESPWNTDPELFKHELSSEAMRNFWRNNKYGGSIIKAKQYFNTKTDKMEVL